MTKIDELIQPDAGGKSLRSIGSTDNLADMATLVNDKGYDRMCCVG
jgi:hypothetical protein